MTNIDALSQKLYEEGFVVVREAVSQEIWRSAMDAVDDFKVRNERHVSTNADEAGYLYRVVNLHLAVGELADAFAANRALEVCDRYFEAPTSLYTSLYYERGSEQDLHRDTPYFCTRPAGRYLGVWLALDPVDGANGSLMVVPGSHRLPPIDIIGLRQQLFGDEPVPRASQLGWDEYQSRVQAQCRERGMAAVEVHVAPGDAIVWHPEMLHGGAPHRDRSRSRRSLVAHVTPKGVPVYHMDVFFHPEREMSDSVPWRYKEHRGRDIALFPSVDFGHQYSIDLAELV